MPRVLISTITPISGGVPTMTRFVVATLRDRGYEPVLAHYEPYSLSPQLSVPSYRLGRQRVGSERRQALDDCESHAIGAWLPELEFTHYWPTAAWRQVLATCAAQVTVGGNALAAMPCRTANAWPTAPVGASFKAITQQMRKPSSGKPSITYWQQCANSARTALSPPPPPP